MADLPCNLLIQVVKSITDKTQLDIWANVALFANHLGSAVRQLQNVSGIVSFLVGTVLTQTSLQQLPPAFCNITELELQQVKVATLPLCSVFQLSAAESSEHQAGSRGGLRHSESRNCTSHQAYLAALGQQDNTP